MCDTATQAGSRASPIVGQPLAELVACEGGQRQAQAQAMRFVVLFRRRRERDAGVPRGRGTRRAAEWESLCRPERPRAVRGRPSGGTH